MHAFPNHTLIPITPKIQILQWAMVLRNAYVDPLNVLQAHVLQRLRNEEYKSEHEKQRLQDALVVTINGISAGMRNSG